MLLLQTGGLHPAPPTDWPLSLLVGGIGAVLIVAFWLMPYLKRRRSNKRGVIGTVDPAKQILAEANRAREKRTREAGRISA